MIKEPKQSLSRWHRDMSRFVFRDHDIAVKAFDGPGGAETLLVIHGFPTCSWDWAWIADGLAKRFALLLPDLMDYGYSQNLHKRTVSLMDQADMLEELLRRRQVKHAHILAHDVGDTVAQELLARRAEGVLGFEIKSVVFLNGGMIPTLHRPRSMQKLLAGPFGPAIAQLTSKAKMLKGLKEVFGPNTQPAPSLYHCLWKATLGVNGKGALARRIRYMAERKQHAARWVAALNQPDLPMRLINGTADPVSGGHVLAEFAEKVPHADIVRLEGIGHFPQMEAPGDVLKAFNAFHDALAA